MMKCTYLSSPTKPLTVLLPHISLQSITIPTLLGSYCRLNGLAKRACETQICEHYSSQRIERIVDRMNEGSSDIQAAEE
jgi:hypothetical protein